MNTMNFKLKVMLGSFIWAWIFFNIHKFCVNEYWCQIENGFPFSYGWFLFLAILFPFVAFINFLLPTDAEEKERAGFFQYVFLTPYSDAEYEKNMGDWENNDNTDWNYYDEVTQSFITDCQPDYFFFDGSRGWRWLDHNGNMQVLYDNPNENKEYE